MVSEIAIRLSCFFGIFTAMALLEVFAPVRRLAASKVRRWGTNWSISVIDSVMVKLLFGAAAVGAAADAAARGWGLMHALDWPAWLEVLLVFVALDFAIWAQHVASHKLPILWRLHQVHHADPDIDVTTAIRFHPFEIALSMVLKIGLVYLLGAPVIAVILFEVVLNGAAMFNHANVAIPPRLERALRWVIVTPDMHRVHHSVDRVEHDTNYGFNLSIWDRLFGTYTHQPAAGHQGMRIGLDHLQDERPTRIGFALSLPFRRRA
ncbi:MAG: sterol desaturase family protein [Pseudomonadota bacterium]